jgi:hypothetical protein
MNQSGCSGMPGFDSVRDGDPLDRNRPAGQYVQRHSNASDYSNWICWLRTQ